MQSFMAKNFHLIPNCMRQKERRACLASWFQSEKQQLRAGKRSEGLPTAWTWDGMPRLWFMFSPSSQHTASLGDSSLRKDFVIGMQLKYLVWAPREAGLG